MKKERKLMAESLVSLSSLLSYSTGQSRKRSIEWRFRTKRWGFSCNHTFLTKNTNYCWEYLPKVSRMEAGGRCRKLKRSSESEKGTAIQYGDRNLAGWRWAAATDTCHYGNHADGENWVRFSPVSHRTNEDSVSKNELLIMAVVWGFLCLR